MTLINKVVFHTYILNNSFSHAGYSNLYEWLVYNCEHTRKTAWTTTIYTKHIPSNRRAITLLRDDSTWHVHSVRRSRSWHVALGNRWEPFSLQTFESQTVPLWTIEHLRRKAPSTSKATRFFLGRISLSTLPSSNGHFDRPSWSKPSFSFNGRY